MVALLLGVANMKKSKQLVGRTEKIEDGWERSLKRTRVPTYPLAGIRPQGKIVGGSTGVRRHLRNTEKVNLTKPTMHARTCFKPF